MTLHYAPTTPEEEELALALALSASLSSAGPSRPNASSSPRRNQQSASSSMGQHQHNSGPRPAAAPTLSPLLNPGVTFPPIPPAQAVLRPPPPPHAPTTSSRPQQPQHTQHHPPSTSSPLLSHPSSSHQPHRHASSSSIVPPSAPRWPPGGSPPISPKTSIAAPVPGPTAYAVGPGATAHSASSHSAHGASSNSSGSGPTGRKKWQLPPQAPPPPPAPLPPISRSKSSGGPSGLLGASGSCGSSSSGGGGASSSSGGKGSSSSGGGYSVNSSGLAGATGAAGYSNSNNAGSGAGRSSAAPTASSSAGGYSSSSGGCGGGGGGGLVGCSSTGSSYTGAGAGTAGPAAAAVPVPAAQQQPQPPQQLHSDPNACAGCGRGFGLFGGSYITGMGRKWHADCFKCGFCSQPISSGPGSFSYHMHPGDPAPYHPDCYRHVHHPLCCVCGTYIAADAEGRISYRENGFWRERYCGSHAEGQLTRCCACSRLQKKGQEWAPLPDGRPLCLQCLSSVQLDTADAQPLYDQVLAFYREEMKLPLPYKPPLLLVDGATLNQHATAEGRDDSAEGPVFHVRGLCVAQVYSHIPAMLRGMGGAVRSVSTALSTLTPSPLEREVITRCEVKVLLLLFGLPRLLTGSIMAHELMHAWLRMGGVLRLEPKVEEGLCQLLACLWLDRQHELLAGNEEEQRLASFFSYQIRTDTSEVYGEGFREAMEAFQTYGLTAMLRNVKQYGRFTPS